MKVLWPVINLYKGENQFVGIMTMASLLGQSGHQSEVVEAEYKQIKARLQQSKPDIVAFSTPSIYSQTYVELNRRLKGEFRFVSVFGGPHPTFFPELIEEEGIDGICIGEGEYAMLELVDNLAKDAPVVNIMNWWIKEDGKIHKNPPRHLIQDLDQLPLPDHEVFRKAMPHSIWQAMVLTGRGCPYGCTFCYNHAYKALYKGKGKIVRRRSVDNVISELTALKRHKCYQFIRFLDDLFILSPEWVREFSIKYKRQIGLPFSCLVRANHVTPQIVGDLKEAGCWRVTMGVEAGDEYVRNKILKRNMTDAEILNACKIIKQAGLKLVTGSILGIPGGSLEADFKTLELNIKAKTDFAGVNLLQPYPRTEIYRYAEKMGMLDPRDCGMRESTVMRTSTLRFRDDKEKVMVENLEKLLPITAEFPSLLPLVKKLIKLPDNKIFYFIFAGWVNYCHYFRSIPPRIGWRNIWKRAKIYHRLIRFGSAISAKLEKLFLLEADPTNRVRGGR